MGCWQLMVLMPMLCDTTSAWFILDGLHVEKMVWSLFHGEDDLAIVHQGRILAFPALLVTYLLLAFVTMLAVVVLTPFLWSISGGCCIWHKAYDFGKLFQQLSLLCHWLFEALILHHCELLNDLSHDSSTFNVVSLSGIVGSPKSSTFGTDSVMHATFGILMCKK